MLEQPAADMQQRKHAPMRIALLTHSVNPRGGVVHVLELGRALHAAGHAVTLMAPALPGQRFFRDTPCAVEYAPLRAESPGAKPSLAASVAHRIDAMRTHLQHTRAAQRFDLLHAHDGIGANALADLKAQGEIAGYVRTVHHVDHFADDQVQAWEHRSLREAGLLLCVSRTWQQRLRQDHGLVAHRVHNGIDLQRYTPARQPEDEAIARQLGLHGGAPLVLAMGGVEARKNSLRLLQAFILLRRGLPRARLVIAGGASVLDHAGEVAAFHALMAEAGLRPGTDVLLTGPVPDAQVPALYRSADVLAMPSLLEGFGLAALEALACGTRAVVSRIAPFTEHFSAHGDVHWADPLDAAGIADALREAVALGRRTPPAVCSRFGWPASALRHAALYRSFLQGDPMPAMHYQLRWPDASESTCYSPSLVIKDYFQPGTQYALPDFLQRVREATRIASDRVAARYGFACSMAADQLDTIETTAARFADRPDARVQVVAFQE